MRTDTCSDWGWRRSRGRPFRVLSQGERQKVLLARACMAQPLLMVLDEPCAGLDPASRESFLAALQALAQSPAGPAMILVTHHLEEIMPAFSHAAAAGPRPRRGLGTRLASCSAPHSSNGSTTERSQNSSGGAAAAGLSGVKSRLHRPALR